jgi:Sulfotransferase domain
MVSVIARLRKPNLFIVGAMKCGTTSWYEYLRSHPDIFMPDLKEPSFFAFDLPNWRVTESEEEYSRLFADVGSAKVIGEASTAYLASETAATAIQKYNPTAKILIFLREQEDCLPSLHNDYLAEFSEDIGDFETAWRLSACRSPDAVPPACLEPRMLNYAALGRFDEQVQRYFDVFPPEQIRVIWFRDWITDTRSIYLEILRFLGLEDDGRSEFPTANQGNTLKLRRLLRYLDHPPATARKVARLLRRVTGIQPEMQKSLINKTFQLLTATGYKEISPELRAEMRQFYAADNRQLDERLASARLSIRGKGDPKS